MLQWYSLRVRNSFILLPSVRNVTVVQYDIQTTVLHIYSNSNVTVVQFESHTVVLHLNSLKTMLQLYRFSVKQWLYIVTKSHQCYGGTIFVSGSSFIGKVPQQCYSSSF